MLNFKTQFLQKSKSDREAVVDKMKKYIEEFVPFNLYGHIDSLQPLYTMYNFAIKNLVS